MYLNSTTDKALKSSEIKEIENTANLLKYMNTKNWEYVERLGSQPSNSGPVWINYTFRKKKQIYTTTKTIIKATKRVVVQGGGENLYQISIYGSKHTVSQVDVGYFTNDIYIIGEARSMDDALSIIKAHSGKSIKKITDW